jgi:hypothetical protein
VSTKVKSLSPHHRFVIVVHSPDGIVKTGLRVTLQRKRPQTLPLGLRGTFSPVRFERRNCEITGVFSQFSKESSRFLCDLDCMAERAVLCEPFSGRFPANREKYREFSNFYSQQMRTPFSKLHILLGKVARSAQIGTGTDQGINRELSGNLFRDQGSTAERTLLNADFAETHEHNREWLCAPSGPNRMAC